MSITQEDLENITQAFEKFHPDYEIEVLDLAVGDEQVAISFPRDEEIIYKVEEFRKYVTEIHELDITTSRVRSSLISQYPIFGFDYSLDNFLENYQLKYNSDGITIKIISNPFFLGIAAVKLGEYSKYSPPCSPYSAVEVTYNSPEKKLNEQEELELIKSFLFEYSYLSGQGIDFYEIKDVFWDGYSEDEIEPSHLEVNTLPKFTEGMELFVKALGSFDHEIRFLFYYKIIEYYSPISAKRLAYETLAGKLDAVRIIGARSKDLESILAITEQFRTSQTDKELAQALITNTVDIVETFPKLPESIQKMIAKTAGFNKADLNYTTDQSTIQKINNVLGSILYSTRNSIVHAKSNYKSDGRECKTEDLPQLNAFLQLITYGIISWYNRLPNHVK
jgi:hypothetical protein